MTNIAERLVFLRSGVTQAEFAQRMGINVNTLRAYEKGRAMPGFEVLESLCSRIGVSPVWILTGQGPVYEMIQPRMEEPVRPEEPPIRTEEPPMRPEETPMRTENSVRLEEPPIWEKEPPTRTAIQGYPQVLPGFAAESERDTRAASGADAKRDPGDVAVRAQESEQGRPEEKPDCIEPEKDTESENENESEAGGESAILFVSFVDSRTLTGGKLPQPGQEYAFRKTFLQRKGDPNQMVLIRASGNDMEPEIFDNDLVLLELLRDADEGIIPGRLYAVGFDGALYLKKIDVFPGKLLLRGTNPESLPIELETFQGQVQGFQVVGRVLWSGHAYN